MLPELLRFSSKSNLTEFISEELKDAHYPQHAAVGETGASDGNVWREPVNLHALLDDENHAFQDDDLAMLGL